MRGGASECDSLLIKNYRTQPQLPLLRRQKEDTSEPASKKSRPGSPLIPAYTQPARVGASAVAVDDEATREPEFMAPKHKRPALPDPSSSDTHTEDQRGSPPPPPLIARPRARAKERVKSAPEITLSSAKASTGSSAPKVSRTSMILARAAAMPRRHTAPPPKPKPVKINASDIFEHSMTIPTPKTKQILDGLVFFLALDEKKMSDSTRGKIKFVCIGFATSKDYTSRSISGHCQWWQSSSAI
jgi:hypothetical protein